MDFLFWYSRVRITFLKLLYFLDDKKFDLRSFLFYVDNRSSIVCLLRSPSPHQTMDDVCDMCELVYDALHALFYVGVALFLILKCFLTVGPNGRCSVFEIDGLQCSLVVPCLNMFHFWPLFPVGGARLKIGEKMDRMRWFSVDYNYLPLPQPTYSDFFRCLGWAYLNWATLGLSTLVTTYWCARREDADAVLQRTGVSRSLMDDIVQARKEAIAQFQIRYLKKFVELGGVQSDLEIDPDSQHAKGGETIFSICELIEMKVVMYELRKRDGNEPVNAEYEAHIAARRTSSERSAATLQNDLTTPFIGASPHVGYSQLSYVPPQLAAAGQYPVYMYMVPMQMPDGSTMMQPYNYGLPAFPQAATSCFVPPCAPSPALPTSPSPAPPTAPLASDAAAPPAPLVAAGPADAAEDFVNSLL
jgi:hypothetical protein